MAEMNSFEDIQESIDYISEAIDSMRAQNAMNAGNTDKVLTNINKQLETLTGAESSDLMKVFLTELKRSLDERHEFVSSKFSEIEGSFNEIIEKTKNQLQAHEIKELFEIIASNLNTFSSDFSSQKDLISQIDLKIEELKQDDSQKKEILKNISTLKVELEKISNGFESVIIKLNANFKELSQALVKLDYSEPLVSLKKDIENVFLSSNAILSTLQVIDRKNKEFEDVIKHLVTKEDFNLEREQVAKLIAQNIELTQYINNLPTQNNFETLTEKLDTSIGVINALKNMITETGKQNQQILTAQLDNLETKILNISSEEEFIGFRKELSEFAQQVIQSTNLMRTDLADTNAGLKDLLAFLSAMDIKNTFINLSTLAKTSENNINANISKLSEHVSNEIEQNKKQTKIDIDAGVVNVNEKIDFVKQEITENSKSNLSSILEHIQSVVNNIFSVKNALHIDNMESTEAIDAKFQDLKEEITTSNNFLAQNAHENTEAVISNIDKISQEVVLTKEELGEKLSQNSRNITVNFSDISKKIEEIKDELNQSSQESFSNILSIVEDFSQEISTLKTSLEASSQENSEGIKEFIENVSAKFSILKDVLTKDSEINTVELRSAMETMATKMNLLKEALANGFENNVSEIKGSLENLSENFSNLKQSLINDFTANSIELKNLVGDLTQITASAKATLEQTSSIGFSGLKSNIEALSQELSTLEENFDIKSQSNLSRIVSLFEEVSKEFNNQKEFLSETAQRNFETISLHIQSLNKKIEDAKDGLNEDLKSNFSEMQNSISALPRIINENQSVFENENKALLEESSKNIIDMSDKIQNLMRSLIAKETPLRGEVLQEFSELKMNLESIKGELIKSDQDSDEKIENEINTVIQNIEESISKYNENYNAAFTELQNKLEENFYVIKQTAQKNDAKLNDSIKETMVIKTEIQTILENISALQDNTVLSDLSADITKKFEGVLLNITQLEEISATKNKESVQNVLNNLEEKFEIISNNLKNYHNVTTDEIGEFIKDLSDKVETVKSQVDFAGINIIDTLSLKTDEALGLISAVSASVNRLSEISFDELIFDVKSKIDTSYISIVSVIKEDFKKQNAEQLEELLKNFESLDDKLIQIQSKSSSHTVEFNNLKESLNEITQRIESNSTAIKDQLNNNEFLIEQFASVKDSIFDAKSQNILSINEAIQTIFQKLEELNLSSTSKEFISSSKHEEIIEKLDVLEDNMFQSQSKIKTEILDNLKENINSIKENLASFESDEIRKEFNEDLLQKVEKINEVLQSISDEIDEKFNYNEENYKTSAQALLSEVKTNFYEKVDDSLDDLKSFIEILENKKDFSMEIDNLKSELLDKISDMDYNLDNNAKSFSEEIDNLKSDIFEKVTEFGDGLKADKTDFSETVENFKSDVVKKITGINDSFETNKKDISETIDNLKSDVVEKITEIGGNIDAGKKDFSKEIKSLKADVTEKITEINNKLEINKNDFAEGVGNLTSDVIEKITEIGDNIDVNNKDFSGTIEEIKTDVIGKITEINDNIDANNKDFSEAIEEIKTDVIGKITEISGIIDTNNKDFSQGIENLKTDIFEKVTEISDNFETDKKDISETIEDLKMDLYDKFSEIAGDIEYNISSIKVKEDLDNLHTEIESSVNDLLEDLLDKLLSAIEENKAAGDIFGKTEEISSKIEDLKKDVVINITEKLAEFEINFENQSKDFSELLNEIKSSSAELKESFVDLSLNSSMEMSNLLVAIQEKIEDIENKVSEYNLSEKIEGLENKLENLNFSDVIDSLESTLGNLNFEQTIENSKEELKKELDAMNQKLDLLALDSNSEINEDVKGLKQEFEEVHKKLDVLALDSSSEIKDEIKGLKQEFDSVNQKLDLLALDSDSEIKEDVLDLKKEFGAVNQKLDLLALDSGSEIKENVEGLTKEFEVINQKLDLLALDSSSEIKENIEEIKRIVSSQGNLVDKLENLEQLDKLNGFNFDSLSKLNDLINVKTEIQSALKSFEEKLDNSKSYSEIIPSETGMKEDLDSFKEELLENLLNIFNQISFVAEAEDIKDFIEEKTNEIKFEINSKVNKRPVNHDVSSSDLGKEGIEDLLSSLDMLHEKADNVGDNCVDIASDIKEVKHHLLSSKSIGEKESEYSYTLQDVESDIAKLRMVLNDIAKSSKEEKVQPVGNLEQLNENIMSISSRTNKILLNSDESYTTLKTNLDDLRHIVYQFEEKVKYIDNKAPIERIERKLANLTGLMESSVKSDKIFNQTFMYLAEWIDRADEKMANIEEKISDIEDVKMSMLKSYDLDMVLDKFAKKFDKQQEKIKSLEEKIEKLTQQKTPSKETDVKTIVREVLDKVKMPEFKPDEKLAKKMDGIDRRLTTLGKNIEKITSYVEE